MSTMTEVKKELILAQPRQKDEKDENVDKHDIDEKAKHVKMLKDFVNSRNYAMTSMSMLHHLV